MSFFSNSFSLVTVVMTELYVLLAMCVWCVGNQQTNPGKIISQYNTSPINHRFIMVSYALTTFRFMKHMCCMLLGPAISKRVTCIIMHKYNEKDTNFFSAFVYFIF